MNSFNNIVKIKYTRNQSECVALQEYILFTDERSKEKYAVLKMANNLNQRLYSIKVEISQYDINDELIEKSIVSYSTKVEANEAFVPKAKLKLSFECTSISFKLVFARFERVKYEHNEFEEIPHKFEAHHATLPPVKQAPIIEKKVDPKSRRNKYRMRESYKKNKAKFPIVFNVFVSIISIAFVVVSLITFRLQSKEFTAENIDYRIINNNEVGVVHYDGFEEEVIIPSKVGGRKVTRIFPKAFNNSNVKKVTISNENLTVESRAFNNCDNLTEIRILEKATLLDYAVYNCSELDVFYAPYVNIYDNTFKGVNKLDSITFATCSSQELANAFSLDSVGNPLEVRIVNVIAMSYVNEKFLDNIIAEKLLVPEDCIVAYGVYGKVNVNGYYDNGTVELINNEVVSINSSEGKLIIDNHIDEFDTTRFVDDLANITELEIKDYNIRVCNYDLYSKLVNLEKLTVYTEGPYVKEIINSINSINTLVVPVFNGPLSSYIRNNSNIKNIEIFEGYVTKYFTEDLPYIETVTLHEKNTSVDSNIFPASYNIKKPQLPLIGSFSILEVFPTLAYIEELKLFAYETTLMEGYLDELNNLRILEVGEGIQFIEGCLFRHSHLIQEISLPENAFYSSMPVIGEGCINLSKVEFDYNNTSYYEDFNLSYRYTKDLTIKNADFISKEYFENINLSLNKLKIEGKNVQSTGLLSTFRNISYLELCVDNLPEFISDYFNEESGVENNVSVKLNTLVLDTPVVHKGFLEEITNIKNIVFKDVVEIDEKALKNATNIVYVYIPETCELTSGLLSNLKDLKNTTILFEATNIDYKGSLYQEGVELKDVIG